MGALSPPLISVPLWHASRLPRVDVVTIIVIVVIVAVVFFFVFCFGVFVVVVIVVDCAIPMVYHRSVKAALPRMTSGRCSQSKR